jgi:hypothetical protein
MIDVHGEPTTDGWVFTVVVSDRGSQTRHRVTLGQADYARLAAAQSSPEEVVEKSFVFLLEREPKEAILSEFNLTVIGRYFPDFETELRRRLEPG